MGVDGWSQLQIRNAEQDADRLRGALRDVLAAYDRFVEDRNLYALSVRCDEHSEARKVLNGGTT